jgi:hypothetical protein
MEREEERYQGEGKDNPERMGGRPLN